MTRRVLTWAAAAGLALAALAWLRRVAPLDSCVDLADLDRAAVRSCRGCGCTDDRACPGGCWWVTDPAGLGDLCSTCASKIGYSRAVTR